MLSSSILNHSGVSVVIDNGSADIKTGFSNKNAPQSIFSTIIGEPKYEKCMVSPVEGFIGARAQKYRGLLKLRYPIARGVVQNWDDMQKIWLNAYEELNASPEEHPVLVTNPFLNPAGNKSKIAEVMFESLGVPSLYISGTANLALYAQGATTGTILDIGDTTTQVVPIYEGYSITDGIRREDYGGRNITEKLKNMLRISGRPFYTSSEFQIVKEIKESCCYLKTTFDESSASKSYKLPDNQEISLNEERYEPPEILFNPWKIGMEVMGIQEMLNSSFHSIDANLRGELAAKLFALGGTSLLEGFSQRLAHELAKTLPKGMKFAILSIRKDLRTTSTWTGGSILASLDMFKKILVPKEEYNEDPEIIFRKALN